MQFIDHAKIFIQSGKGGDGAVSFRREKFVPQGGPDGGDGGRGGSIIFLANPNINTLLHFRFNRHFKADSGNNGSSKNKYGKAAEDLILEVPLGTQIFDETSSILIYDFKIAYEEFKILSGGRGGLGNTHFKSSINQAPLRSTKGEDGGQTTVLLNLKILSDAGLVGLPNAGKSTFLSVTTAAKPKIADYPFTTLTPGLGVSQIHDEEFVIADIPGLIEGAHMGSGLGDKFLQHIERCGVIVHLIDINSEDVLHSYRTIRKELESYSEILAKKFEIICLNKIDLKSEEEASEILAGFQSHTGKTAHLISAAGGKGIDHVLRDILDKIKESRMKE